MTRPRDLALLDAYVSGELDDAGAAELEEAMFSAIGREEVSSEALYLALRDQLRLLAERGTFHPVLLPPGAARLRETSPLRVGIVEVGATHDAEALLASDILLVRVPLALEDVTRLDIETLAEGEEPAIYPDVPFDATAGCVWMACEIELAKESLQRGVVQRFVAVRGETRTLLREIRLDAL